MPRPMTTPFISRILFLAYTVIIPLTIHSQGERPSSISGIQVTVIQPGISGFFEPSIRKNLVIRSELSFVLGFASSTLFEEPFNAIGLNTVVTISPRLYYNFHKRVHKKKSTRRNSANFVAIRSSYLTGLGFRTNETLTSLSNGLLVIPTWGIRRSLGKFQWELSAGLGYRRTGLENEEKTSGAGFDLRLGIGF